MLGLRKAEHVLGFEAKLISSEGLSEEKVRMVLKPNSRSTSNALEKKIVEYWRKHKTAEYFDGDRARFEGLHYDKKSNGLSIAYSYEKYRTYFFFARNKFPRAYHPKLLGTYLTVITGDGMIPIGLRERSEDRFQWWSIVPAGYVDVDMNTPDDGPAAETPWNTATREATEEWVMPDTLERSARTRHLGKDRLIGLSSGSGQN